MRKHFSFRFRWDKKSGGEFLGWKTQFLRKTFSFKKFIGICTYIDGDWVCTRGGKPVF